MTDLNPVEFTPASRSGPRRARRLMFQGTSSDVGKSLLVAGLCRAYHRRGLTVRPFKAQNMSNNAAVAADSDLPPDADGNIRYGEIGRAQALQARACGAAPSIHMNPVLLKPQSGVGSQVVLRGRVLGNCPAKTYHRMRQQLMPAVLDSLERISAEADLVIVEGAGSGAEVYLRASDITNMRLAEMADLPVVFVTDTDRGGAMGALVGSRQLLAEADRARVRGYLINKFRGDLSIFEPGMETITAETGWPCVGVVRWFERADRLPAEDSLALERPADHGGRGLKVVAPRLSRVANFDDLDPLSAEPGIEVKWVNPGHPIPRDADVIVLPGSKVTRIDLEQIRAEGWDVDIRAHVRTGGRVIGLCAGFQMLGRVVADPEGIEGEPGATEGLGLLDIETVIGGDKRLVGIEGVDRLTGARVSGYEMHMGRSTGPGLARPWLSLETAEGLRDEGAVSPCGRVMGGYLHGVFAANEFRAAWMRRVGAEAASIDFEARTESALDDLAEHLERNLDLDALLALAG